jgi:hypothetical protein
MRLRDPYESKITKTGSKQERKKVYISTFFCHLHQKKIITYIDMNITETHTVHCIEGIEECTECTIELRESLSAMEVMTEQLFNFQKQLLDNKQLIHETLNSNVDIDHLNNASLNSISPIVCNLKSNKMEKETVSDADGVKEMIGLCQTTLHNLELKQNAITGLIDEIKKRQQELKSEIKSKKKIYIELSNAITLVKITSFNHRFSECITFLTISAASTLIPYYDAYLGLVKHRELFIIPQTVKGMKEIELEYSFLYTGLIKVMKMDRAFTNKLTHFISSLKKILKHLDSSKRSKCFLATKTGAMQKNIIQLQKYNTQSCAIIRRLCSEIDIDEEEVSD